MNNPIAQPFACAIRIAQRRANRTDRIVYVVAIEPRRFKVTETNSGDVWIALIPDGWRF